MKNEIGNPFAKLEEEDPKVEHERNASFENIYVTRNIIAFRKLYLTKECEWSETQIEQFLDPLKVLPGRNPHSQHFMEPLSTSLLMSSGSRGENSDMGPSI